MAGSLRKRPELGSDAWELRVFLGRDIRGRVRHKSRTFRGSKRAAEKELRSLLAAQDFQPEVPPEPETKTWNATTTVNDAIAGWKHNGWADLSPVTVRRYENVWNLGTSEFDARTLQKLSAQLQGIGRFIGVLQRTHADSAAFTDLLDASDAVWRAAVALERAAGLSAP